MFKSLFFAVSILLFPALPASADSFSYETGLGFYDSEGSRVNLLRYRHDAGPLFGLDGFYEASYASWNGPYHDEAFALARGIEWLKTDDHYMSFTLGLSRITRTTGNLGEPFQFYIRFGYEKTVGRALFSLGWIHYSDGKLIFGWPGNNNSENFATFSVGILL